jgi:hypothetical protein
MINQKTTLPENIYEFYLLCVEVLKQKHTRAENGWFKYKDDVVDMTLSDDGSEMMVVRLRTGDVLLFIQKHNPKIYSSDYVFVDDHLKKVVNRSSVSEAP